VCVSVWGERGVCKCGRGVCECEGGGGVVVTEQTFYYWVDSY